MQKQSLHISYNRQAVEQKPLCTLYVDALPADNFDNKSSWFGRNHSRHCKM